MRYLIVFVLFIGFKAYSVESSKADSVEKFSTDSVTNSHGSSTGVASYADLPVHQKERLEQAKPAVWKIINKKVLFFELSSATAFFVSPNYVVTNWHVISDKDIASLSLEHDESEQKFFIKRLVSISALHDLALLEVEGESPSHLTLRESSVSSEEELFLLGYPIGTFRYTLKTSHLKNLDDIYMYFFVNSYGLKGNSGGPVLDTDNRVVGVLSEGTGNYIMIIRGDILRDFIAGDIGTNCNDQNVRTCIKEELRNLQELAKGGDRIAQYELAGLYYTGGVVKRNSFLAKKWLSLSAEQAHPLAQYYLGKMYYYGKGVEQDSSLAMEWYRLSAEQSYAPAQYFLGKMYDKGYGVEQDSSLAMEWYRRSAEQGYIYAKLLLFFINN